MKLSTTAIPLVFAFLCTVAFAQELSAPSTKATNKIGIIASLTGAAAANGENWFSGAKLAEEDLKNEGSNCELVVEDDQTTPVKVASAFAKLATVDKVKGVVGGTWDFLAETAYPYSQRYQIPFITPTNPIEVLSPQAKDNPWIYVNGLSLAAEKGVIRDFLVTKKIKSLALVYINVPFGTLHADLLKELAKELKIEVTVEQLITYESFADTLKLGALSVKNKKPDLVFIVSNYEGIDIFLRELERFHSSPFVLMTHTLKEAFDFAKAPTRYRKAYGVFPAFNKEDFSARYEKRFGHPPYGYTAAGYDAVMFLCQALKDGYPFDNPTHPFEYNGISGQHFLPASSREIVRSKAVIMTTENGVFEPWNSTQ